MFKKLNNKGFSHIETFLFVIVIVAITGVGFFVYSRNQAHAGSLCGNPVVAYGSADSASKNNCVKDLQTMLNTLNNYQGTKVLALDGIFGPLTKSAVKEFQNNNRLTVDGMAGAYTFQKLCSIAVPAGAPASYAVAKSDACTTHAVSSNKVTTHANPSTLTVKSSEELNNVSYKDLSTKMKSDGSLCLLSNNVAVLPDWQTSPGTYKSYCNLSQQWAKTMNLYSKFISYANDSGYTNGNDRNTGGGTAQNQGPIGVKSTTCHDAQNCTQGVLTKAMAYSVVCGDLAGQDSNASIALTCYAYTDRKYKIDSFFDTIKDYNMNLNAIQSQSYITPQMKTSFENDIATINSKLPAYHTLLNNIQDYLKRLNSDIWNNVNGNDYLAAYSKIHKSSFCAVYDLDKEIGGANGSGFPLTINTTNYASQDKCKTLGLTPNNGKATVWWNNGAAVQAYGWN